MPPKARTEDALSVVETRTGKPFTIHSWGRNTFIVRRTDNQNRSHSLIVTKGEAVALSNALIDVIEGET